MKQKCRCGRIATWLYMPGQCDSVACDACVPRGCSCNTIDPESVTGEEYTDERGRLYPCCEWNEYEHGMDDESDWIDYFPEHRDMKASIVFSPDFDRARKRDIGEACFNADTGEACMVLALDNPSCSRRNSTSTPLALPLVLAAFSNRLCAGHYFTRADVLQFSALEMGRLTLEVE